MQITKVRRNNLGIIFNRTVQNQPKLCENYKINIYSIFSEEKWFYTFVYIYTHTQTPTYYKVP